MKLTILASIVAFLLLSFTAAEDHGKFPFWPERVYVADSSESFKAKVYLGKVLFYDPQLSADGKISCASCHSPYSAFTHIDHALSHGVYDSIGTRNAPALINLTWQEKFMWDGAINHLDVQAAAPLANKKEMGISVADAVSKVNADNRYASLFQKAFGESKATGQHVLQAYGAFMSTLVSNQSLYDKVMQGEEEFTEQQQSGYNLFLTHCNDCHREPLFSSYAFEANGLKVDPKLNDFGRMDITNKSTDSLLFKVPTLRNVEYSYPYMHDGRFKNLTEVLNHYATLSETKGGIRTSTLQQLPVLSERDQADLMSFLLTLSDKEFVFNPAFTFPREFFFSVTKDYEKS
jgi:cytochrome c peroxidase